MSTSKRRTTNEQEFQGEAVHWLNDEIAKRPGIKLDKATQEKPRKSSGKRNDLVVWIDRASEVAFLSVELKTPATPISDPVFFDDALEKALHWKSQYFALWNMRELEVYVTPPAGHRPLPSEALQRSSTTFAITQVEDWLKPPFAKDLKRQALVILDTALDHRVAGIKTGHAIDSEIFVSRLTEALGHLRSIIYKDLNAAARTSRKLSVELDAIAVEQGFKGFVDDIHYAIAGQMGYRFIGQILFYFALRRKIPALSELSIAPGDDLPNAFQPFWNEVRRYDYEALFKQERIETLVPIAPAGQALLKHLVAQFAAYDWASLSDDVLGAIFEHLIPRQEQDQLGQFYTPRPVADLLVAFTLDGERPLVLDPGSGSGTFLMAAYSYLSYAAHLGHKDLLDIIWGFDISPFAAELAVINLYRQDMSQYENFPRIVPGNFFDRKPGDRVEFPAPRASSGPKKIPVPIPQFDCIVGNPPYLRSQNQDDLDSSYRTKLFQAAIAAGIDASSKTDLFVFFIYHALRFMKVGSRLGFVTPSSWLTADYAVSLQRLLLNGLRLVAVIGSGAESFFPQVDVNAVLLVAEKVEGDGSDEPIRFVTLKQPIAQLTDGVDEYWTRVTGLVRDIESIKTSKENKSYRVKLVDPAVERAGIAGSPFVARNWSVHLRAPISYTQIFEGW